MHEFEYAELHGLNFHEFNGSLKLRKSTVAVCGGDPYAGLLLEYLLHQHQSFYDALKYARELPEGSNSLEDAYYKGLLNTIVDHGDIQESTFGIFPTGGIRKAENALKALNFLRIHGNGQPFISVYHLNLGALCEAFALAGKVAKCEK